LANNRCCEWSKYNGGCGEPCDFKSLPYEKDAILERIRKESDWLTTKKQSISLSSDVEVAEKLFLEIADKLKGIQIMVLRLQIDFGMTNKELREILKVKKDPISSMKLSLLLAKQKFKRGKK
jgi:hypothetical protein